MSPVCRIAVVIPAHTCPCRQVSSILPQLCPSDRLVIVFNGLANTERCKRQIAQQPRVTWIDAGPAIGAACARNLGARAIKGAARALIFCDADDQVAATWLTELAGPLLDGSADLVGGALRVRGHSTTPTIVAPAFDYWHRQALFGGNMGVAYEAWCKLRGFDESFRCCEDTDLAWRANRLGFRVQVVRNAIVDIDLRSPFRELLQRFEWGRSSVRLLRRHGLPLHLLPGLKPLLLDKKTTGFAANAVIAAAGQWAGQWTGRWTARSPHISRRD